MFKKVYSISFNTNGGKNIDAISCKAKKEFPVLQEAVREGYKFVGWFTDAKLENPVQYEKMPKCDLVLYAKWECISLEEFAKDINFYTKSANILKNLQNDYEGILDFKDSVKKEGKSTKKKTTKKKTTKKVVLKNNEKNEIVDEAIVEDLVTNNGDSE